MTQKSVKKCLNQLRNPKQNEKMLQPELIPNQTTMTRLTSGSRTAMTPTPKLPDFTEDPFRNYRYEDPFAIADPFADEEDNNGNKKGVKLDAFGFETTSPISTITSQNPDPFGRSFESDFSKSFTTKSKSNLFEKNNDSLKNGNNLGLGNSLSSTTKPVNKPINFDEAFSNVKSEKSKKKSDHSIAQAFRDKLGLNNGSHFKNKNNNNNNNNNGNNTWSSSDSSTFGMTEKQQLEWAAQQSLRAEEERNKRMKAREDADLALALELSKKEKSSSHF